MTQQFEEQTVANSLACVLEQNANVEIPVGLANTYIPRARSIACYEDTFRTDMLNSGYSPALAWHPRDVRVALL